MCANYIVTSVEEPVLEIFMTNQMLPKCLLLQNLGLCPDIKMW